MMSPLTAPLVLSHSLAHSLSLPCLLAYLILSATLFIQILLCGGTFFALCFHLSVFDCI